MTFIIEIMNKENKYLNILTCSCSAYDRDWCTMVSFSIKQFEHEMDSVLMAHGSPWHQIRLLISWPQMFVAKEFGQGVKQARRFEISCESSLDIKLYWNHGLILPKQIRRMWKVWFGSYINILDDMWIFSMCKSRYNFSGTLCETNGHCSGIMCGYQAMSPSYRTHMHRNRLRKTETIFCLFLLRLMQYRTKFSLIKAHQRLDLQDIVQ